MNVRKKSTKERSAKKAILVLGMHRSGTSAVTGVLDLLGCATPLNQITAGKQNPKGFFEAPTIARLNDCILESAGTSWHDWRQINPAWFQSSSPDEFIDAAKEIIAEEFGDKRLIAIKDPRICRLVPFWLRAIKESGFSPLIIHTHRNPVEVALSLEKRNSFDTSMAMILWLRHILDAEMHTRGMVRSFTGFAQILDNTAIEVSNIQDTLNLTFPKYSDATFQKIETFLSEELVHHRTPDTSVIDNPTYSAWIRDTFEIMQRWALKGEDVADHKKLDIIGNDFNNSIPAFSRLILANEARLDSSQRTLNHSKATLTDRDAAIETANASIAAQKAAITDSEAELAEFRTTLKNRDVSIETANASIAAQKVAITNSEAELAEFRTTLKNRDASIEAANIDTKNLEDSIAQIKSALRQRQHEADQMRQEASDLRKELDIQITETNTQKQQITKLKTTIETEKSKAFDSNVKHQETFRKLAIKDQELGKLGQIFNNLLTLNDTYTDKVSRLKIHVSQLEDVVELEKSSALESARKHQDAVHNLQAVLNSTSWRLLSPLRGVITQIRRLFSS